MSGQRRDDLGTGLRALGSPVAVCALVVLLLNDHVLKQAAPGWVTGKLSDVAGLVVAPLLVALLAAALGVRRPLTWATAAVVVGFMLCKTTGAGAATVSALWSLSGIDTHIRADPTDLLALPAVLVARRLWRQAGSVPDRRRLAAVVGLALLPMGVLATAATGACDEDEGVRTVDVVTGRLGEDAGQRTVAVLEDHHEWRVVEGSGTPFTLPEADRERLGEGVTTDDGACASGARVCWRRGLDRHSVEVSADGGRSWQPDLEVTAEQRAQSLAGLEESCGQPPSADLVDLEVLDTAAGPVVVVAARHGGAWLRDVAGEWRLLDREELASAPTPASDGEPAPGRLRPVPPVAPPHDPPTDPGPEPSTPPRPPCRPSERQTVTPDPANGGPVEVCP